MSLLNDMRGAARLKVLHDGRKGSLLDQSGNGLALTTIGTGHKFQMTPMGWSLGGTADSGYSAGTSATLDLTVATMFCAYRYVQTPAGALNQQMLVKGESMTTLLNGYYMYITAGFAAFALGDGAGFQAVSIRALMPGHIYLVAHTFNGASVLSYVNGLLIDTRAQTRVPTPAGKTYKYGMNGTAFGLHDVSVLMGGLISGVLRSDEIARMYDEFLSDGHVDDTSMRMFFVPQQFGASDAEYARQGMVLATDFLRQPGGLVRDATGNYAGTVTGVPVPGQGGEGLKLAQTDLVDFGNVTQFNNAVAFTESGWLDSPAAHVASRYLSSKYVDANNHYYAYVTGAGATTQIRVGISNAGAATGLSTAAQLRAGCRQHYAIVYNGAGATDADRLKLYIDGEVVALTFAGSIPASLPNLAAANYQTGLGVGFTALRTARQTFIRSRALSAAEVRAEYLRGAQNVDWEVRGEDTPVSVVASYGTANPHGLGSGWRIISGTWKRSETSDGRRWIECVTAGVIATLQPHAFGTWLVTFRPGGAGNPLVCFAASAPAAAADPSQNGYLVRNLVTRLSIEKQTAGAGVYLLLSSVGYLPGTATETTLAIARRVSDGRFDLYNKGSGYGAWTRVTPAGGYTNPTVADAAFVTSSWMTFEAAAGDKLLDFDPAPTNPLPHPRHYVGPLNPLLGEVPA